MAQVVEIETLDGLIVIYNLHLESRSVSARMGQVEETLADARKYPKDVPVVIAGDLNTHFHQAKYGERFKKEGFESCFGDEHPKTQRLGRVDWILVRGPAKCTDAAVHHGTPGSDHYPITVKLLIERTLRPRASNRRNAIPVALRRTDSDMRVCAPRPSDSFSHGPSLRDRAGTFGLAAGGGTGVIKVNGVRGRMVAVFRSAHRGIGVVRGRTPPVPDDHTMAVTEFSRSVIRASAAPRDHHSCGGRKLWKPSRAATSGWWGRVSSAALTPRTPAA